MKIKNVCIFKGLVNIPSFFPSIFLASRFHSLPFIFAPLENTAFIYVPPALILFPSEFVDTRPTNLHCILQSKWFFDKNCMKHFKFKLLCSEKRWCQRIRYPHERCNFHHHGRILLLCYFLFCFVFIGDALKRL